MNSLTHNVFNELNRMRCEMDRFLGAPRSPRRRFRPARVSFHPGRTARAWPLINVSEEADSITVDALLPGVSAESLDVSLEDDRLTISGEQNGMPEDLDRERVLRRERRSGSFERTVTLPREVDGSKIEATFRNGLLQIVLPRAEETKPKKIAVNAG
jgi:HSP20 family protein